MTCKTKIPTKIKILFFLTCISYAPKDNVAYASQEKRTKKTVQDCGCETTVEIYI